MPEQLLSIIVPIYNEEKIVAAALPKIFALPINKEVIIVNDGSTDQTAAILIDLAHHYSFRLINQPTNRGKGAAVKRGLEEISGDYFIVCDADLEYEPTDILALLKLASTANGRVAIYGSRFLTAPRLTGHYLINRFLTVLTNSLFGGHLTDMETCFKLIPRSALPHLKLRGRRFEIEPEITAQLLKAGYQIQEIPIHYARRSYQEGKKIKARDGLLAIRTLVAEKLFRS
jgi:glycosyltransferase involved in cell wall biosynthesis